MNYDLTIIGGGLSGMFAAARAAELGVKSIAIFEKGSFLGGNGRLCKTFVASAFADYGDFSSTDNDVRFYRKVMNQLHQTGNPQLIQKYLFAAKHAARWLEKRGAASSWAAVTHGPFASDCSQNVENAPSTKGKPLGAVLCDILEAEIKKSDCIKVFLDCPAKKLLTDEGGSVVGAVVEIDGKPVECLSKKLILSCGGAGGSFESLCRYLPKYMAPGDYMKIGGVRTCTGDGIAMAAQIGAETEVNMNIHLLGPDYMGGYFSELFRMSADSRCVAVNRRGHRVLDEAAFHDAQDVCNVSPGKVFYTVFGKELWEKIWAEQSGGKTMDEFMKAHASDLRAGHMTIADTVQQAAEFIGCDAAALKKTFTDYDATCKSGWDGELLKDKQYLVPLGNGPYYVFWQARSIDSTQGGITVNDGFEAVTSQGKAIKGMYVTGDHVTGFVSQYYGPGGAGMTFAMCSGFLCGQYAAMELA